MDWTMEQHKFNVALYGCSSFYFGRKFKFTKIPKLESIYVSTEQMSSLTAEYMIVGVARHTVQSVKLMCFKFYDSVKHRIAPHANSGEWLYIPCKYMMSTDSKKCCVDVLAVHGNVVELTGLSLVNRRVVRSTVSGMVKHYDSKNDEYAVEFVTGKREVLSCKEMEKILR
jgi:hypothetical protein